MMSIGELFRTALHSLRINPLRSALSVLGVIFGIAAVIVLISMGQGVRSQITDQIKALGTDLVVVKSGQEEASAEFNPNQNEMARQLVASSLVESDVKAVAGVEGVKSATGTVEQPNTFSNGDKTMSGQVIGGGATFARTRKLEIAKAADGWTFEKQEPGTALIGQKVAEVLFGSEDAIGKPITIGATAFTVKGLLKPMEKSMFIDPNKEVYVPLDDARDLFGAGGSDKVREIYARVGDPNAAGATKKEVISVLRPLHQKRSGLGDVYKEDFFVATQDDLMKSYKKILGILSALVVGVALVALAESGIGVSNIMYIAVKERTREIGVRLAQGASKRAILAQFLIESITLCLLGAAIGIPFGWLVSVLVNSFTALPAQTPLWGVLVAFGAALLVGVVAGVYPAWKATKADIAVALRSE
jgi:putative ABC transport system permease protein